MSNLLLPLLLLFFLNFYLSYLQFINIKKTIVAIKQKQPANVVVTMGNAKSKLSLKRGALVILSISEENAILDFYEMVGRTIFSRAKLNEDMIGLPVDEAYRQLCRKKGLKYKAFEAALDNCPRDFSILKEAL